MAESQLQLPHKLTLSERCSLSMTGVTEVIRFDPETVILRTCLGMLTVQGQDLNLRTLSVEMGQVAIDGTVSALVYEEPRRTGGLWSRLFP